MITEYPSMFVYQYVVKPADSRFVIPRNLNLRYLSAWLSVIDMPTKTLVRGQ